MTPLDDLKPGQWVAIFAVKERETTYDPFRGYRKEHSRSYPVNGKPLKILAISLPFVCVTDGRARYSIDVRDCELKKLSPHYVRVLTETESEMDECGDSFFVRESTPNKHRKRKRKKADTRGCCPNCGTRLRQRRVDIGTWSWVCNECGFIGGNSAENHS